DLTRFHRSRLDIDGSKPARNRRLARSRRRRQFPDGLLAGSAADECHRRQRLLPAGRFQFLCATTTVRTSTLINTTPDVLVGLFNDTTATALNGGMTDQFYGADVNYRMRAPQFASFSNVGILFGIRYAALDEKLSASVNSVFSRNFRPELGIPVPTDFTNSVSGFDTFRIRNDFIGPQVGFNAEQHWGPYWVTSENKLAVGAMIERASVSD